MLTLQPLEAIASRAATDRNRRSGTGCHRRARTTAYRVKIDLARRTNHLMRQLQALGYQVQLTPTAAA
ncbi:hypothetical protein PA7_13540 [Pseudonocardia asaccharolytica DSM 44247 = NBRC 16224]|uniref:Uncharacterized protein n=1 Tax=Pseudonocardia asaccharolytica DSM 44247 = NBRC 16224 TaxID=1123024 RepID=A0A511CYH3_9PSEU|nr:hypothetical protein PA7_13540 [Pseudonocardia asaccharolytica DSM 44247 = NBRC 16224]